jgi:hypothetical protein
MHDEISPGFAEEFIREVVTALGTIGAKNKLVSKTLQPEISLQPSASIPVDLQGVPSAQTFGSLEIFSDPAESKILSYTGSWLDARDGLVMVDVEAKLWGHDGKTFG